MCKACIHTECIARSAQQLCWISPRLSFKQILLVGLQLQKGSLHLQCIFGFQAQREERGNSTPWEEPTSASEIFIIVTKEAQRVLRLPNDHVKNKTTKTPNLPTIQNALERIWAEDLCYSSTPENSAEREIENRRDTSTGRAQIKTREKIVKNNSLSLPSPAPPPPHIYM